MSPHAPRVAIVGSRGYPSYYGGYETIVRRVSPLLVDRGWDVTVYGRDGATAPEDPHRDHRVRTHVSPGVETKALSTLSYGLTGAVHAAAARPDVVLMMNTANGYVLPALRARRIPVLLHVDGIEWERDKWSSSAKKVFRGGAYCTAKWADELVFDSTAIRETWGDLYRRDGTVIYHGGDFPEGETPVVEGLTHRGYVLAVMRFVPENTFVPFLEAAERLATDHDVVLVGSSGYGGGLDEAADDLAARMPRFRWMGHVTDPALLQSLWQHCGAYFHGHSVGGTNPSLVQAISCGSPVVARDTPYNREVLAEHGTYVEPRVDDIVAALGDLLRDPTRQEAYSTGGRTRAEETNRWDDIADRYDAMLTRARRRDFVR